MLGFFKKPKSFMSEEEKRAAELPRTKKVQFEPMSVADAEKMLAEDIRAVLTFVPVNYYATKDKFLQCNFHYAEDYSEIYMQFELRVNDLPREKSRLYSVDKLLMRDILRKFGVNINI